MDLWTDELWSEALPIGDLAIRGARRWPDTDAVVFPGERLTYAQLAEDAVETARRLRGLGVGPGEHVGILMANCIDYTRLVLGVTMLGATAVVINARYQGRDLAHVVVDADVSLLVTSDLVAEHVDHLERIKDAFPGLADTRAGDGFSVPGAPRLRGVVVLADDPGPAYVDRAAFDAAGRDVAPAEVHRLRAQVPIRAVGMMMYTSGTTALPKGCLLSHEMIVRNGMATGRRLDVRTGDRFWDPLPMFHMSSVLPLVACLAVGGTFISMTHFDAETSLDLLEDERVTHCYPTFPTITQALLNHPRWEEAKLDDIRVVNNVAPPSTLRKLQQAWPDAVQVTAYGSTETGGVVSFGLLTDDLDDRIDTSGPPFPGIEVRVVDPHGEPLPAGQRGELCVRGYSLFEGYHGADGKTDEQFDDDGWFHTGDIGRLDEEGRISYLGRLKDMLKVGGENVAAAEIEALLQEHPDVSIAAVVGIPDERLVEVPAAFVELRPDGAVTGEQLIDWTEGRIANFKRPVHARVITEWPMSATKIQKFRLRDQLMVELGLSEDA